MKLSIVVVSFNTRAFLEPCLGSIRLHPPRAPHEIIVVDNGSTDGSPELVTEKFLEVRLIPNAENRGFTAANNQAFQVAKGEYLFLMNSDAELLAGSLDRLVAYMEANPAVGIVGPTERLADGTRYPTICPFPDLWFLLLSHSGLRRRFNRSRILNPSRAIWEAAIASGKPVEVDWLSGASLLVRRALLEQIGGFDEAFFFYMEETDLCRRARTRGWRVAFLPTAEIVHHGGQSTGKAVAGLLTLSGALGELRYFEKHRRPLELALLKGLFFLEFLLKLLLARSADPRRWAYREVLRAALGRRPAQVTKEDLCRR